MKPKLYGKIIAEGRWSAESGQMQNLPTGMLGGMQLGEVCTISATGSATRNLLKHLSNMPAGEWEALPRLIPVLNRIGRVVAHCQAPKVYSYE